MKMYELQAAWLHKIRKIHLFRVCAEFYKR